jgi:hypothetical protein
MRVSGNIFERLIIKILPLSLVFGLLAFMTTTRTIAEIAKLFLAVTIIFWGFDSLTILTKGVRKVIIKGNQLVIGKDEITIDDILSIVPRKDIRRGIDIKTIEIEYLKDGLLKKQKTMTKPTFFDLFGKKFKTIDLLNKHFPNLKNKVGEETED